jgi:DNA-binding NarL/FixJ family response regulator
VVIRVLIVDDHPLFRMGLRMILESQPDIEVVGEAANGAEALSMLPATAADVVLLDIQMSGTDGMETARRLAAAGPEHVVRVLVLTAFDLDEYVDEALALGVGGFTLKSVAPADLLAAVRAVAGGDAFLAPPVARRAVDAISGRRRRPARPPSHDLSSLTLRERQVLRCLARGLSNREIAASLDIGEATVRTHMASLLRKLELRDRTQAAIAARDMGLTEPE